MKTKIQYYWGEEDLTIDLGERVESRIRMILCGEFVITASMASVFLIRSFQVEQSLVAALLCLGACVLYVLATYRLIARISYKEKLTITKDHISISVKTLFGRKTTQYDWRCVGTLHYVGKDINHLHWESADSLSLPRRELLLQDLHQAGNLFFVYKDTGVRFARGIYSWHAEEIVTMIQLYDGGNLKLGEEWKHLIETSEWEE